MFKREIRGILFAHSSVRASAEVTHGISYATSVFDCVLARRTRAQDGAAESVAVNRWTIVRAPIERLLHTDEAERCS